MGVIDDALLRRISFGLALSEGFGNDGLVGVLHGGEAQPVVDAVAPEIDTGPGGGQVFIRIVEPVAGEHHVVGYGAIDKQGAINDEGASAWGVDPAAGLYRERRVGIHADASKNDIRQVVGPGDITGDDPVAQEVGILAEGLQLYIAVVAIVIDQDAVTNDEGQVTGVGLMVTDTNT